MAHVATQNVRSGIVGGIAFGESLGIIADGDLTGLADAIADVKADADKLHVACATFGERVYGSLRLADGFLSGYTSGGDVSDIYAISVSGDQGRSVVF